MRTILLGDITAAARALLSVPQTSRPGLLTAMIKQADAAHDYHKRFCKPFVKGSNAATSKRMCRTYNDDFFTLLLLGGTRVLHPLI